MLGVFSILLGEKVTFLSKNCPRIEVCAIFVSCFSCHYLAQLGLRQLGLPAPMRNKNQHLFRGNNSSKRPLMQHLHCACVVAFLSPTLEKAL